MNRFIDDGFGPTILARLSGCFLGGGSSSGSQQSTQSSTPVTNPQIFELLKSNVESARNVAARPFQAYDQPMTAGVSSDQLNAANSAGNLTGYNAPQVTAQTGLGGISAYQNPYTQQVVDPALADIERQRAMAVNQGNSNATFAHAFGGARQGVSDSLTNEAALRAAGTTSGNLRSQGFNTSAGLLQADQARQLAAAQGNQNASLAGANTRLAGATLQSNIGQQEQSTQQTYLTNLFNEFMRGQNYPVEMQQLISQAMGLVPGAAGQSSTGQSRGNQSSFNFSLG